MGEGFLDEGVRVLKVVGRRKSLACSQHQEEGPGWCWILGSYRRLDPQGRLHPGYRKTQEWRQGRRKIWSRKQQEES